MSGNLKGLMPETFMDTFVGIAKSKTATDSTGFKSKAQTVYIAANAVDSTLQAEKVALINDF